VTDPRALLNRWSDAGLRWSDSSLKHIASMAPRPSSSRWPLWGMFTAGLLVGAVGAYAVTRRSQIRQFLGGDYETLDEFVEVEASEPASFESHRPNRSNNRRKAAVEVS
jgi:hypothetical protein